VGRFRRAIEFAEEGAFRATDDAEGLRLHNLTWVAYSAFHLGDWDRVVDETLPRIESLLGDRERPYFVSHAFGVTAFILAAREDPRAERYVDLVRELAGPTHRDSLALGGWLAWTLAHRGDADEALAVLRDVLDAPTGVFRPHTDAVRASILSDLGRFEDVPAFVGQARAYAEEAGLIALPAYLNRLEGLGAAAEGDHPRATELLRTAVSTFDELAMPWERARAELSLADVLAETSPDDARALLVSATAEVERLGSVQEIALAAELRRRLD
jgi:hypothetical protein